MEAARAAVSKITGRTGHSTDVNEIVNPAVTRETVKPTRHEETTQAIDKEVHQDHFHTTVQPLAHKEVLPEQHSHQMAPVQKREFTHGDHEAVKRGVTTELGQFKDSSTTHETHHTRAAAPTVAGEHVHHHVHESVQPVIHKETVQPEVVHTTVPIHETHHASAQHHGMSALPLKSLSEFTSGGGALTGSQRHTHEQYEGAPRPYNKDLQTTGEKILNALPGHHTSGTHASGGHHTSGTHTSGTNPTHTSGTHTSGTNPTTNTTTNTTTSTHTGHHHNDHHHNNDIGNTSTAGGPVGAGSNKTGKPSLMDKLNPRKDVDGDGKAGIMD